MQFEFVDVFGIEQVFAVFYFYTQIDFARLWKSLLESFEAFDRSDIYAFVQAFGKKRNFSALIDEINIVFVLRFKRTEHGFNIDQLNANACHAD